MARELAGPLRIAALMEESRRMAAIDALTGIANRRAFVQQGEVEVNRSRRYQLPLSVLLMDVDHFKQINDKFGHAVGDRVLAAMGAILKANLRMPDIPARWGGEEFVVALPSTSLSGAETVAERLRAAVEESNIQHDGAKVPTTISIGVAELSAEDTLEAVVERADHAMYEAKSSGRNRVKLSATPKLLTGAA
jgi:diguanylate cyclase (GGDEF)-like protein